MPVLQGVYQPQSACLELSAGDLEIGFQILEGISMRERGPTSTAAHAKGGPVGFLGH